MASAIAFKLAEYLLSKLCSKERSPRIEQHRVSIVLNIQKYWGIEEQIIAYTIVAVEESNFRNKQSMVQYPRSYQWDSWIIGKEQNTNHTRDWYIIFDPRLNE